MTLTAVLAEIYSVPPAEVDRWPAAARRSLNRIHRCPGCGGWHYRRRDRRPCPTCKLLRARSAE